MGTHARRINEVPPPPTVDVKQSLAEQLFDALRREILTGVLAPGEVINEPAVAARYSVSKTPAREALRLLVHSGWIVALARKGYLVKPLDLSDLSEIFALRKMLEPQLAAEAARQATAESVSQLHELVSAQAAAGEQFEQATEASREFHLVIARVTGNERAVRVVESLLDDFARLIYLMPLIQSMHKHAAVEIESHRAIADAIARHDADAAQSLMLEHITADSRNVMTLYTDKG